MGDVVFNYGHVEIQTAAEIGATDYFNVHHPKRLKRYHHTGPVGIPRTCSCPVRPNKWPRQEGWQSNAALQPQHPPVRLPATTLPPNWKSCSSSNSRAYYQKEYNKAKSKLLG